MFEALVSGHWGWCGTLKLECAQITCIGEAKAYFLGARTMRPLHRPLQQPAQRPSLRGYSPSIGTPRTARCAKVCTFELLYRQNVVRLRSSLAMTIPRLNCLELGPHSLRPAAICNDNVQEAGAQELCQGIVLGRLRCVSRVCGCASLL